MLLVYSFTFIPTKRAKQSLDCAFKNSYNRDSELLHCISYRIASLVWHCLLGLAPVYLCELCCPLLSAMSSRSLRSSQQGLFLVPFARTSTKQSRAFSVVGP